MEKKIVDWTGEQTQVLDLYRRGYSIRIQALAGCGKTTALREVARASKRPVTYLAYNTEIAKESRLSFPGNATCATTHGLARRQLPPALAKKNADRGHDFTPQMVRHFLTRHHNIHEDIAAGVAYAVFRMLETFCITTDTQITSDHFCAAGVRLPRNVYSDEVLPLARSAWLSVVNPEGELPLFHDAYLKYVFLMGVRFDSDLLLVDEVQDLNPLTLALIARANCQLILVGDRHQELYAWRGARKSMDVIRTEKDASLTLCFRLGEVGTAIANRMLAGLGPERLRPNPKVVTKTATRHQRVRLVRSNTTLFVKTVERAAKKQRVHILGGTGQLQSLVDDVERLQSGRRVYGGVLSEFQDWQDTRHSVLGRRGSSLSAFVKMADELGVARMRSGLNKLPEQEKNADIVMGTVHASKGREWDAVSIYHDFKGDEVLLRRFKFIPEEQMRLVYVAVTRASKTIYLENSLARRFGVAEYFR